MLQNVLLPEELRRDLLHHHRMYCDMCMFPKVDGTIFVKVARDHCFQFFGVSDTVSPLSLCELNLSLC